MSLIVPVSFLSVIDPVLPESTDKICSITPFVLSRFPHLIEERSDELQRWIKHPCLKCLKKLEESSIFSSSLIDSLSFLDKTPNQIERIKTKLFEETLENSKKDKQPDPLFDSFIEESTLKKEQTEDRNLALVLAIEKGSRLEIIQELLKEEALDPHFIWQGLQLICKQRNRPLFKSFFEKIVRHPDIKTVQDSYQLAWRYSFSNGDPEFIDFCLSLNGRFLDLVTIVSCLNFLILSDDLARFKNSLKISSFESVFTKIQYRRRKIVFDCIENAIFLNRFEILEAIFCTIKQLYPFEKLNILKGLETVLANRNQKIFSYVLSFSKKKIPHPCFVDCAFSMKVEPLKDRRTLAYLAEMERKRPDLIERCRKIRGNYLFEAFETDQIEIFHELLRDGFVEFFQFYSIIGRSLREQKLKFLFSLITSKQMLYFFTPIHLIALIVIPTLVFPQESETEERGVLTGIFGVFFGLSLLITMQDAYNY